MNSPDFDAIVRALDARKSGAQYAAKCPAHDDAKASLSLGKPNGKLVFKCHAGCSQDDIVAALRAGGLWPNESGKQIVAEYDYVDRNGVLIFQAIRYQPKDFRQRRPDGSGGWIWNLSGINRVLFNLPAVLAAIELGETVAVVEGEKDVENLRKIGIVATTNAGGAGKWRSEYSRCLKDAHVVILPDNDTPGRKHADQVAKSLANIAAQINVVELPGLPPKGDVSDWLAAGGTREDLLRIFEDTTQGKAHPTPHAAPTAHIDGAALLDSVHAFLGRFVAYPDEHAHVAHTLWIPHTHMMDAWESTPRIAFLSPEPGSGKTRAIEITETLVPRPVESVNATPAYLFRKVSDPDGAPTLLYDEIDTLFGPKAKDNEEIRGMLNAGHRRGAMAGRCVVRGKLIETEELPAYCAVAIAGLGALPDTLLSRCVVIPMRRRAPGESVEPYRRRLHAPDGNALRDQLAAWAASIADKIADVLPDMPAGVQDRYADMWEPLLAVADMAGGDWPARSRVAAVALVALAKRSTPSLGVRLLSDLRQVFGDHEAMATEAILADLVKMDEAPWGDLKGKPIDSRRLANLLRPYGVTSKNVRIGDRAPKGYTREDLFDSWNRYLPNVADVADVALVRAGTPVADKTSNSLHSSRGKRGRENGGVLDLGPPAMESATSATNATNATASGCLKCGGEGCAWCEGAV
jgi:hypothetical protein